MDNNSKKPKTTTISRYYYRKLSEFNHPLLWGIMLAVAPIIAIIGFSLFYHTTWMQSAYWPYPLLGEFVRWGLVIFYAGLVLLIVGSIIFWRSAFILFTRRKLLPNMKKRFPKILLKFCVIASIIGGAFLFSYGLYALPFKYYNSGPYITWTEHQDPSDSITVNWYSSGQENSKVLYGTDPNDLSLIANGIVKSTHHHEVSLEELDPNTRYYYEVQGQDFGIKSFKTAPATGIFDAEFNICLYADPRTNNGYHAALSPDNPHGENLPEHIMEYYSSAGTAPAFSIIAGDIVGRGVEYDTWKLWLSDITTSDFASNYSHQVAVGNHEHYSDPIARNMKNFYPHQEFNYSFTFGQVHVIVLNTYDYDTGEWYDIQFPEEQKIWADADLTANADIPFKIITLHHSAINRGQFSIGGHHGNVSEVIRTLAEDHGVDLVFSGHSHVFDAWRLNGVTYIQAGIGGNHNRGHFVFNETAEYDVINAGGEFLAGGGNVSGFLDISVTENMMEINTILVNGSQFDPIYINK